MINIEDLKSVMNQLKDSEYPQSEEVEMFIADVVEHFGEVRRGS